MLMTDDRPRAWRMGNAILHRAVIQYCQRKLGPRPYLDGFQRAFDAGCDAFDLQAVARPDRQEYRNCLAALTALGHPIHISAPKR